MGTKNIEVIFWDFDGVLMNSNEVRDQGFVEVLKDFPGPQVEQLLAFHRKNGGLSRYVKFRYFFESIRKESITEEEVAQWAEKFSIIMKKLLVNESLFILETLNFVKKNYQKYDMHIVSGSDGNELRFLCEQLGIAKYFISVNGSPTPKEELVKDIIESKSYIKDSCILIGDSINDFDAATSNRILFYGFNNVFLKSICLNYLEPNSLNRILN